VSADRFVSIQFCDDIRQELGGKFSLMGCYGPIINIKPIPSVLPKLCASIKIHTPISRPFQRLAVRIMKGDASIAELLFPTVEPVPASAMPNGAQWSVAAAMIVMAPFAVESACTLRVEVETEEGVLHGGSIWIQAAEQSTVQ
jgi:hypothetical protein